MGKYKLSDEEKKTLKVAKLNQENSESMLSEMDELKKSWTESNRSDDDFLSLVEKKLGIVEPVRINRAEAFQRESKHCEDLDWPELVAVAEKKYNEDVNFEDLLSYSSANILDLHFDTSTLKTA